MVSCIRVWSVCVFWSVALIGVLTTAESRAQLFQPEDIDAFRSGYVEWMAQPAMGSAETVMQRALEWCKTTIDYIDPIVDCQIHPNAEAPVIVTKYPYSDGTHFYIADVIMTRRGGYGGRASARWNERDTGDGDCEPNVVDRASGHGCVDPNTQHAIEPPIDCLKDVLATGNPCDPATGNKSQTEVDFRVAAQGVPTFIRYYNSSGPNTTGVGMSPGWRHSYSRELDGEPELKRSVLNTESENRSAYYYSAADACTSGWDDIKTIAWGGNLSSATASYSGGDTCTISSGGSVKAHFPVRNGAPWRGLMPATSVKTFTRPNGSSIRFEPFGNDWLAPLNGGVSLEQSGSNWVFTNTDDSRETYDSSGRLISIAQRNGQTETLHYELTSAQGGDDDPSTLDKVTGPFGHALTFSYDGNGQLVSVTTPDGTISYGLDANGNLSTVTYPDLTVRQYVYEDADLLHHLTGIVDENNDRFATWAYDDSGRAIMSEHAGGKERVDLTFNGNGSTTIDSANGASRTYSFATEAGRQKLASITGDVCSDCAGGSIKSRTYDANGYLEEATDWNDVVTRTDRNSRGLTETLTEAKGTAEQRVTTTTWHATFRLPLTITTPKNTTTNTYDTDGNLKTVTISGGTKSRAWSMTYDTDGRIKTIDGPRTDVADVTTITYHNCATGNECGQVHTVANPLGHVTTYNAYDAAGRVTLMTEPNGLQTGLTYDWRGNVLMVTETPTVGSAITTTMTYDDVGQLETLTTPEGTVLTYTYTDAHYLESVTDILGNEIRYTHGPMGNITDEDTYDPQDILTRSLEYTYGLDERIDSITNGSVATTLATDLVGNLETATDGLQFVTQHDFDVFNRLDATTDALNGVTGFGYDAHDNLTSVAAPTGATTSFVYDELDNLMSETSPDRGLVSYTHDAAGNVLTRTDARGIVATYTYDALNRISTISYPNSAENVTYGYDNVLANGVGRLTSITDQSGTTTYTYDEFGRLATDSRVISGNTYTIAYSYDDDGNRSSITYPSGRVVSYLRNSVGEVTQVTSDKNSILKTIVSSASYKPFGPISSLSYGNGITYTYDHNTDYSVSDIQASGIAGSQYTYDAVGNITTINDLIGGVNFSYSYDALGRLESDSYPAADYSSMVLADSPLVYWRLGESSGSTASDDSGNGNDGTYNGAILYGQPGLAPSSDTSIRSNDPWSGYVSGPTLTGKSVSGMETWFQSDSGATYYYILELHDAVSVLTHVYHHSGGKIAVWRSGPGTVLYSDTAVTKDEPHHLAIWYEPVANSTYLMIDGVLQNNTYTGNLLAAADPQVWVAGYNYYGTIYDPFLGYLDEVAVYDGAVDSSTFADRVSGPVYAFTYDANGNRESKTSGATIETLTYTTASNRLATIDGLAVSHDAAGNRTGEPGGIRTYEYSDANRLDTVKDNGLTIATYVHNALGQRTEKTSGGSTTVFVYDLDGNLLAEHDSNGALVRDYVWLNGVPVAQVNAGEAFSYLHFDHLGTPRMATDDSQTVVWRWDSDAFGSTAANNDPDGNGTPLTVNLRFPGQYYDVETAFHYNYHRTYDPATGRYLESDPIGLNAGLNTYAYVENMPTMRVDPFGLFGLVGHNQWRLEQARRQGRGPKPGSIYTGGEGTLGGGAGFSIVTCCDENDNRVEMTFTKTCIGPSAGAGLAAGFVTGLSGKRCAPQYYEGYFLEINAWMFSLDFGVDPSKGGLLNGGATGTNEYGIGYGYGGGVASCFYTPVMTRVIGSCSCN